MKFHFKKAAFGVFIVSTIFVTSIFSSSVKAKVDAVVLRIEVVNPGYKVGNCNKVVVTVRNKLRKVQQGELLLYVKGGKRNRTIYSDRKLVTMPPLGAIPVMFTGVKALDKGRESEIKAYFGGGPLRDARTARKIKIAPAGRC